MRMGSQTTFENNTRSFSTFLSNAYIYLFGGLLVTAAVAYFGFSFAAHIITSFFGTLLILGLQLGLCFYFTSHLMSMSKTTATVCFFLYCIVTGLTLSYIPILYDGGTLALAAIMAAVVFGCMAIIGHTTNADLSRFAPYMSIGLIAIVITTLINMFIGSRGLDMVINYAGIIIFLGIVAWDMQKLRQLHSSSMYDTELSDKLSIYGAFELYLDFINIFLYILRIFANNSDND